VSYRAAPDAPGERGGDAARSSRLYRLSSHALAIVAVRLHKYNSRHFSLRQMILQGRFMSSVSTMSLNLSGMKSGVFASTRAPVSEIFLTLQAIVPPVPKSMMPDFNTGFLGAIRL
jgi:hypothetical protein